ncbi:sodium/proline symporter [candidate division WOR-3 bacterium]|nr:sodium/proline symporter [candidate division WOR-3 bacterium]
MVFIAVLIIYLVVLILIGFFAKRGTRTVEDFYIGGRNIGPWVTAISFIAAYFSSVVIIGGGGFGYKFGMSTVWVGAANVLVGCTLAWIILGERVRLFTKRLSAVTVPDFFGERFRSKKVRLFSAIIILIFMIVYNVSILKGMGHIFEVLMDIPYFWGLLISGIIIVFYVAIGGYLAVVWSGLIQGIVMIFGVALLTVMTLKEVGGFTAVHDKLMAMDPGLVYTPGLWGWAGLISFCLIVSFGVWGMPQLIIRFYSIKSTKVLKIGTVVATIGGCMAILPYFNGACARALYPMLSSPDLAIPTLSKNVLSPLGSAILLAGVVAAGMSTFASILIIIASSVVRDIYEKGLGRKLIQSEALKKGRLWSAVIGIISLIVAIKPPALVLVLCAFAWAVIASTTLWPMLVGIYWKGATKTGVITSMAVGCITAILWIAIGNPFGIHGFIPGLSIGLILILIVSKFTHKLPDEHIKRVWGE